MRVPIEITNKVNSMGTLNIPTILSLSSGILILVIYIIITVRQTRDIPKIGDVLSILLAGIAIPQSIYVCTLAFNKQIVSYIEISPIFFVAGGLAVAWLSLEKIIKMFRKKEEQEAKA